MPDRIDYRILAELQKNARLSNKELAAIVDLAPSTCVERVKRLKSEGAIQSVTAQINPEVYGIGLQALIAVQLQRHSREMVERFLSHIEQLREVVRVYHLAGVTDFLIHVAVRDDKHLRNLLLDSFTTREEVSQTETSLIFECRANHLLPNYAESEDSPNKVTHRKTGIKKRSGSGG
ncbi:MAG: Lrp/AsnC family transcriptional regulator [Blastocatellia bacterium]|nr:Lrp/AsnC family transcriptional regulator [Blastocatellia bacterium]